MNEPLAIIDAFIDGERVDAAALKQALADEAGRDYFVDAWLLREEVQDELARDVAVPAMARPGPHKYPLWLAAAIGSVALGGGYFVGYRAAGDAKVIAPTIVVEPAHDGRPFPAPLPTRVIQMEFPAEPETRGDN
jgi:hypothetical protein